MAFCDSTGQLGTLFEVAPAKKRNDEAANEADELDYGDIAFEDDEAVENNGIDADDADNDDEDDENTVSLEKLKNQVMKGSKISEEDEDSKMSVAKSYTSERSEPIVKIKTFKAQAAFQPSSTPSHLEHFYMVWNGVGIVTAHSDNSDNGGSIHVEFHDASVHHALHIPNFNNSHTLASLSTGVLALSGGEDASKLVCIALAASGNKEWSLQMPDTEVIEAVATTKRIVAVVTNINMLRLFSSMGTQREVIGLPGPVVAIAGSETEERFIVVYHSAPPGEHQQYLSAMLVQASYGLGLNAQTINLPLPKGRTLSWLGFSDVGSPAFADSMGLVQLYNTRNNCWYAICDTLQQRQSVSNNYFVIAISERQQILQAVLCRGCSYPMTNPRPMLQELPLRMPLCDLDSEKSEIEDALLRASLMSSMEGSSRIIKETAIKLFALACRSEIELRAKELIETIGCPDLLLLAVKYATKLGRIHLADRLSELMPKIEENHEKKTQEENEILQVHLQQKAQFLQLNSMLSPGGHQSPKVLAPKAMELSSTKRSSLKRLASPFSSALPNNRNNVPSSPSILGESATQDFSQENFGVSENSSTKSAGDTQSDLQRTPLNSVNPFASKRKLADSEVILGSDKLKFPKRDLK